MSISEMRCRYCSVSEVCLETEMLRSERACGLEWDNNSAFDGINFFCLKQRVGRD